MPNELGQNNLRAPQNRMPQYREIYNHSITHSSRPMGAEHSVGFQAAMAATNQLNTLNGRALDIGCGVGFVVEFLSGPAFQFRSFGIDISDETIVRAIERTRHIHGLEKRFYACSDQTLPFEDDFFSLVTCFDVLQRLEETDIDKTLLEIHRVLRGKSLLLATVFCLPSQLSDQFGDNFHRTVKSPDWWIAKVSPDRVEYDCQEKRLTMWKKFS